MNELKNSQIPTTASLRATLLDPAVNSLLQSLRNELQTTKSRLEDTQNELSAWKFTPDSNTGKHFDKKKEKFQKEAIVFRKAIDGEMQTALPGERGARQNDELGPDRPARGRAGAPEDVLGGGAPVAAGAGLVPRRPGRGRRGHAEHDTVPAAGAAQGQGVRRRAAEGERRPAAAAKQRSGER